MKIEDLKFPEYINKLDYEKPFFWFLGKSDRHQNEDEIHLFVTERGVAPEGSTDSDKGRYDFVIHSQENLDDALKLFDGNTNKSSR